MKILIYTEPHPIRNTMVAYNEIPKFFQPLLNMTSHDIRLFANHETLTMFIDSSNSIVTERIIFPTSNEQELFYSLNSDWQSKGIENWKSLMGQREIAKQYLPVLKRIYRLFPFDIIIYWGENGAIKLFQQEQEVTAIGIEQGCTRYPFFNSLIMDVYGTNGNAIVPKLTIQDIIAITNKTGLSANDSVLQFSGQDILGYEQQFAPMDSSLSKRLLTNQPKVFFPLQLFDDANLVYFSHYTSIQELVVDIVPQLIQAGYLVILKPHPASHLREGSQFANQIAYSMFSAEQMNDIIWCDEKFTHYNNIHLIQLSDFVVTVNSSVGFEALFYDKPVVVLGKAVYKPKNLFPSLQELLEGNFNKALYLENISYLRKFLLTSYLLDRNILSHPTLLLEHLLIRHSAFQRYQNQPYSLAKFVYEHTPFIEKHQRTYANLYINEIPSENLRLAITPSIDPEFLASYINNLINYSEKLNFSDFTKWLTEIMDLPEKRIVLWQNTDWIDEEYYLKIYDDVKNAGISPLIHYAHSGIIEGRLPNSAVFQSLPITVLMENLLSVAAIIFKTRITPLESSKKETITTLDANSNF